jgi:hypothetical protein
VIDDDKPGVSSIPLPDGMERISDDDMPPLPDDLPLPPNDMPLPPDDMPPPPDEIPLPETKHKICIQVSYISRPLPPYFGRHDCRISINCAGSKAELGKVNFCKR